MLEESEQLYEDPKEKELKMTQLEKTFGELVNSEYYQSSAQTELATITVHNHDKDHSVLIKIAEQEILGNPNDNNLADLLNNN